MGQNTIKSIGDEFEYEGGKDENMKKSPAKKGEGEEEKKELTPAEKKELEEKREAANTKAKALLGKYVGEHKCLMGFGLFMNIAGMVGEFVTPLFIGWVIDAIVEAGEADKKGIPADVHGKWDEVNTLIWQWMVFNAAGSIMQGL